AGTSTRRSSRAGTPPSTGGYSRTSTTRPRACAPGVRGSPRRGGWTSRRRSPACCGTCGSWSPPAPSTRPRSSTPRGSRGTSCSGSGGEADVTYPEGVEVLGPPEPRFDEILTDEALAFVAGLQREFGGRRAELLEARAARQARLDEGERPGFL